MDCFKGCGYILNVRSYGKLFTAAAFPISNRVFLVGGHARISKCVFSFSTSYSRLPFDFSSF